MLFLGVNQFVLRKRNNSFIFWRKSNDFQLFCTRGKGCILHSVSNYLFLIFFRIYSFTSLLSITVAFAAALNLLLADWLYESHFLVRPSVSAVLPVESTSMVPLGRLACLDRHLSGRASASTAGSSVAAEGPFPCSVGVTSVQLSRALCLTGSLAADRLAGRSVGGLTSPVTLTSSSTFPAIWSRRCPGGVLGISPRFLEYLAL